MNDNLRQFNIEINNFCKKVPGMVTEIQKKIVLESLRQIVLSTPVDTGRARGNWQVTIAQPSEAVLDNGDKNGIATITKGLAVLTALPSFQVVYIANNLEYIEFLEDGTSKQAPEGMVSMTVEELRHMFK